MADDLRKKVIPIFRIAVLGSAKVGKTSIIKSFVNNSFDTDYEETENDLRKYRKVYDINHNLFDPQYILFQIEDIFPINHEDLDNESDFVKSQIYCSMFENRPVNLQKKELNIMQLEKQIYGYVFVFDATAEEQDGLKKVEELINYISDYCEKKRQYSGLITKKILVANKVDLLDETKKNKIFNPCQKILAKYPMPTYGVSALTGYQIANAFEDLGKQIIYDIKMEMKEGKWFKEIYPEIKKVADDIAQKGKKEENDIKNKLQKGFLGCGGRDKDQRDSDGPQDDNNEEDLEFANLPMWNQPMNEQDDGCEIY